MIDPKILEKARKLKALADRGVGGEKENAQRMLEEYMKKHGLKYKSKTYPNVGTQKLDEILKEFEKNRNDILRGRKKYSEPKNYNSHWDRKAYNDLKQKRKVTRESISVFIYILFTLYILWIVLKNF